MFMPILPIRIVERANAKFWNIFIIRLEPKRINQNVQI
jgi:hypothetical protein